MEQHRTLWVAPLDEDLPLVRLNRMGAALLGAMNGRLTIHTLLEQFGTWICGPNRETGQWYLERWALPRYSLCYFGMNPPAGHSVNAKWDLLLQKVREQWHENVAVESEDHLTQFHHRGSWLPCSLLASQLPSSLGCPTAGRQWVGG